MVKAIVLLCIIFMISAGVINNKESVQYEKATFAGGCFWCMEPPYDKFEGVIKTTVGFTGGNIENPSYEDVITGKTGHYESIEIIFNPKKTTYKTLVDEFWKNIDPTNDFGQFADFGSHYKTAIFYHSKDQEKIAMKSKEELIKSKKFNKPIVTKILKANTFYKAEDYHQNYYKKNPLHYNRYKKGSGRESYINETWK